MTLQFHQECLKQLGEDDSLLILARGIGLHKVMLSFLSNFVQSSDLVMVLNVSPSEQQLFIEELLEAGTPLQKLPKRISNEYTVQERTKLYLEGGVQFVASTVLVMDLLYKRIPAHVIKGFVVNQAHRLVDTCSESFILKLFRQGNKTGFIKGFSEYPEAFTTGFCKVEKVMKNLFVTKLHLWPRFRDLVDDTLTKHRPDVVELFQPMTPAMKTIQQATVEIIQACIDELKKSNLVCYAEAGTDIIQVDIGGMGVNDGLFKEFDVIIRSQLDPVWHKVSSKTRQLVNDLATLRKLLEYLVSYDCVTFWRYLETLKSRELTDYSVWMFMDAADRLFATAKSRVFKVKPQVKKQQDTSDISPSKQKRALSDSSVPPKKDPIVIDDDPPSQPAPESSRKKIKADELITKSTTETETVTITKSIIQSSDGKVSLFEVWKSDKSSQLQKMIAEHSNKPKTPEAKPQDQQSTSNDNSINTPGTNNDNNNNEPLPPSDVLVNLPEAPTSRNDEDDMYIPILEENPKWQLLAEVLNEIELEELSGKTGSVGSILVMVKDDRTCTQLEEYLEVGAPQMLKSLFKSYLQTKHKQQLKREEAEHAKLPQYHPARSKSPAVLSRSNSGRGRGKGKGKKKEKAGQVDYSRLLQIMDSSSQDKGKQPNHNYSFTNLISEATVNLFSTNSTIILDDFDNHFGVVRPPHIVIHASNDRNRILEDLRPKYVIMYDPDVAFFRQLEVYKCENPGMPLRIYWLWYADAMEQTRYLTGLEKEQKAFESLIHEKAVMVVPAEQDGKTVIDMPERILPWDMQAASSTRKGGKNILTAKKRKILVDSREFRSALPAILYQREFEIEPYTLDVGDYILTPQIAVERKSLSDLQSSLNSGRLYNQATQLCKYFTKPVLLIEFQEDQPFSLQDEWTDDVSQQSLTSKLVLLTIHFPKLRIIWCRSPYATSELFEQLKKDMDDPDSSKVTVASSTDDQQESAEDILKTLPGINLQNYRTVMDSVKDLAELSSMSLAKLTDLIGKSNAKQLYDYFRQSVF